MSFKYHVLKLLYRLIKGGAKFPPAEFQFQNFHKIPDFIFLNFRGEKIEIRQKGKKLLLVNVASECGFTPQYQELENLYLKHKDRIQIIAFPSNDFGAQEPGTNEEIALFCKTHYKITFPITQKITIKGSNKCELYQWLTDPDKNGWNEREPDWNFCKYLIDENGFLTGFYPSHVIPEF